MSTRGNGSKAMLNLNTALWKCDSDDTTKWNTERQSPNSLRIHMAESLLSDDG